MGIFSQLGGRLLNNPQMKFLPSSGRQKRCSTKQFLAKLMKSAKKPHKLVSSIVSKIGCLQSSFSYGDIITLEILLSFQNCEHV